MRQRDRRRSRARLVGAAALALGGLLAAPAAVAAAPGWQVRVNLYRAQAGLAPVGDDPALDTGASHHSIYMVRNNVITHPEDPSQPWYTADGNQAGTHGNVAVDTRISTDAKSFVDEWQTGPFHQLGILSPNSTRDGYGDDHEPFAFPHWQSGATLDVSSDAVTPAPFSHVVTWPGDGSVVPVTSYQGGESPDPEEFCPTKDCQGLPMTIQTSADGSGTVHVTAWSVRDESGNPLETFEFDPTNTGADPFVQSLLAAHQTAVLFPRPPLLRGHTYTASVTVNGTTQTWSFSTNPSNYRLGPGGYTLVGADGAIFPFAGARGHGGFADRPLNQPIVGAASTPSHQGYWMVASDGGIFPFGDAGGHGSHGGSHLNQPIVGMAATPSGGGYWLVASDGGIFPYGDAVQHSYGSTGGIHLNQPVVGMAQTSDGNGYYLVASDGGIFPFGDAQGQSYGSTGGTHLNQPIVGMAANPNGGGYWLVAGDGGVFPFGPGACGCGSLGNIPLNKPIIGMTATPSGNGYWLLAADGGVFPFGDAIGYGSTGDQVLTRPIVALVTGG